MTRENKLTSMLSVVNQKPVQRLLTPTNFEILNIRPWKDPKGLANTCVKIKVDLYANISPTAILATDRYAVRDVHFYRPSLKEAAKLSGLPLTEDGSLLVADASDIDGILATITTKLDIKKEEITHHVVSSNLGGIYMKKDSLGFTGNLTLVTEGEVPEPVEKPTLVEIISQADVLSDFQPASLVYKTDLEGYVPMSIQWSLDNAPESVTISNTGVVSATGIGANPVAVDVVCNIDGVVGRKTVTINPVLPQQGELSFAASTSTVGAGGVFNVNVGLLSTFSSVDVATGALAVAAEGFTFTVDQATNSVTVATAEALEDTPFTLAVTYNLAGVTHTGTIEMTYDVGLDGVTVQGADTVTDGTPEQYSYVTDPADYEPKA